MILGMTHDLIPMESVPSDKECPQVDTSVRALDHMLGSSLLILMPYLAAMCVVVGHSFSIRCRELCKSIGKGIVEISEVTGLLRRSDDRREGTELGTEPIDPLSEPYAVGDTSKIPEDIVGEIFCNQGSVGHFQVHVRSREMGVVDEQYTSVHATDHLISPEAQQCNISKTPTGSTLITSSERMCTVLDEVELMIATEGMDCSNICGHSKGVLDQDGLGLRCDGCLYE